MYSLKYNHKSTNVLICKVCLKQALLHRALSPLYYSLININI